MTGLRDLPTAAALAAVLAAAPAPALADRFCDPSEPRRACPMVNGSYHVRVPDGAGPFPAVVMLHSSGESGADFVTGDFYAETIVARGFALIVPNGSRQTFADGSSGPGWHLRETATGGRDDITFIEKVIENAATRFDVDPARVLLTGYGLGASLAWETACLSPDTAAAYAPRNGGFYTSLPEACRAPFRLLHVHSRTDDGWPLVGPLESPPGAAPMPIQDTLQLASDTLGCEGSEPVVEGMPEGHQAVVWRGCGEGAELALVLHDNGNLTTAETVGLVLDWFLPDHLPPEGTDPAPPGSTTRFIRPPN